MKALRYTKRLVSFDSTSSISNREVSRYLETKLTKHGFIVEKIEYKDVNGQRKVNLIAKKGGGYGGMAYFSHSDVVPADHWFTDEHGPFEPTVKRERLYGRGSCDMKGSIACMLAAAQQFSWDDLQQPLYFVVTADEEVGFNGARIVVEESKHFREMVDHGTKAVIGEPTSLDVVHAHKGSIRIIARAKGVAAHSGTDEGKNANLDMIPFLAEMKNIYDETTSQAKWQNNDFQPPTVCLNIGVKDNAPALNITAAESVCTMYLRTMPGIDVQPLLDRMQASADANNIDLQITKFADPFFVDPDSDFVKEALELSNRPASRTVSYGTDGGIFSELENKIVFGPGSIAQAHKFDEWISLEQLELGTEIYSKMVRKWCAS